MRATNFDVSRRDFISRWAPLVLARPTFAQTRSLSSNTKRQLQPKLITTFEDTPLLDISPDARKLCVSRPGYVAEVIEIGSWRNLHSLQLRARPLRGSFFAEGNAVYIGTEGFRDGSRVMVQRAVVDLATETDRQDLSLWKAGEPGASYTALGKGWLLGEADLNGTLTLILATLPDYREVYRTPAPKATNIAVPSDRSVLVYGGGRRVVCRRAEDLKLAWDYEIEGNLSMWKVGITPIGDRVVAAAVDTANLANQRIYYVVILDGADGALLKKFPLNGFDGVQVSPDGSLLAVCNRIDYSTRKPSVSLYDVRSGEELARLVHDAVPKGQEFLLGALRICFSADGRYMATSGLDTKIWGLL